MVVPTDSEYVASMLAGSEFEVTADAPVIDQDPRKAADSVTSVMSGSMLQGSVVPIWGSGAGAEALRVMKNGHIERKMGRNMMVSDLLVSCKEKNSLNGLQEDV